MAPDSSAYIEVGPRAARADEPVRIRLGGLPPGATVTVRARMPAWPGHGGGSRAMFLADEGG